MLGQRALYSQLAILLHGRLALCRRRRHGLSGAVLSPPSGVRVSSLVACHCLQCRSPACASCSLTGKQRQHDSLLGSHLRCRLCDELWACRCAAAGWLYDDQLIVYEVVQAKKSLHALRARMHSATRFDVPWTGSLLKEVLKTASV